MGILDQWSFSQLLHFHYIRCSLVKAIRHPKRGQQKRCDLPSWFLVGYHLLSIH